MKTTVPTAGFHPMRHDQLRPERVHDTYQLRGKLHEPTVCAECGAAFHQGRWQWLARPAGAHEATCPACHRTRDHFPAGFVVIGGPYFTAHRDELMKLLHHHADKEKVEHPLARIIAVEDTADGALVTTTDIHLARNLGTALHHAHQGELEFHYNEGENLLRVHWRR